MALMIYVDHFSGKSVTDRTAEWLNSAFRDAILKYHDCAEPAADGRTFPAHAAMWNGLAGTYQAEIERRRTTRRHKLPPGECAYCDRETGTFHPSHDASRRCKSGKHAHCSCDCCF